MKKHDLTTPKMMQRASFIMYNPKMESHPQPSITQLFTSFLRLGLTAFGGPSMVVYIRKMSVEKKHWLDAETFNHGVALCQMIPGATAMQTAAYVGLTTRGVIGAAASFIGFGLPAFLIMMVFAALYTTSHNIPAVLSAFNGLQAVIVAIIANAAISFGINYIKDWRVLVISGIAALLFGLNVNPVFVILLAAGLGWLLVKPKPQNSNSQASTTKVATNIKPLVLILSISSIGFLLLFIFDRALFNLAILMFRIDLFAFGGGFASVPLMYHEIVEVRNWMDGQTLMNGIALGQITPGPIVITATFIGYLLDGWFGGIVATIGIFIASFIMVVAISPYFGRLRTSPAFNKIIDGVLGSFVGLLLTVTIRFALNVNWDLAHILLASGTFIALLLKVDILWVVLAGTIISVVIFL
jgi:chromate transporter